MDNTKREVEFKSGIEVLSEVEDLAIKLYELPDVIALLIESLKLDVTNWTENEVRDLVNRRDMIYNILTLVQRNIWEVNEGIGNICIRKDETIEKAQTERATQPTKVVVYI